ncbi:PREDICTED: transmembrane emp24 domain-containing protein 5 [Nipponia nippon]|nr:PREDICTED: transmembrane emp24 domain-containing protein 5 [Nipponia nippon]
MPKKVRAYTQRCPMTSEILKIRAARTWQHRGRKKLSWRGRGGGERRQPSPQQIRLCRPGLRHLDRKRSDDSEKPILPGQALPPPALLQQHRGPSAARLCSRRPPSPRSPGSACAAPFTPRPASSARAAAAAAPGRGKRVPSRGKTDLSRSSAAVHCGRVERCGGCDWRSERARGGDGPAHALAHALPQRRRVGSAQGGWAGCRYRGPGGGRGRPPRLLCLPPGCLALLLPPPGAAEFSPSLDSDFTFTLPAGRKECFYQPMRKEASLELEYQVLDGAGLDVDFHLLSPNGETLVFDERKSDGVHTVETEDGDYMFCFDNTFSTISEKVIFFELILDNMGEDGQDQEDWKKYVTGTDLLDMKLEDILESINSVKARLSKSVQIQTLLRAFEARDRNIQESNFDRVNFWSMVNLGVMVVVSAVQVYMLKSLFEDKRKSRT